jgi:hypothetical protein
VLDKIFIKKKKIKFKFNEKVLSVNTGGLLRDGGGNENLERNG